MSGMSWLLKQQKEDVAEPGVEPVETTPVPYQKEQDEITIRGCYDSETGRYSAWWGKALPRRLECTVYKCRGKPHWLRECVFGNASVLTIVYCDAHYDMAYKDTHRFDDSSESLHVSHDRLVEAVYPDAKENRG